MKYVIVLLLGVFIGMLFGGMGRAAKKGDELNELIDNINETLKDDL